MSSINKTLALRALKELPSLVAAAEAQTDATNMLEEVWWRSEFRKMLIENLNSKRPVVESPEEYPRLRCYRGTGHVVKLIQVTPTDENAIITIKATYVHEGVDVFDESEGCPGAPTEDRQFQLYVPNELFTDFTRRKFHVWAQEIYRQRMRADIDEAEKKLATARARAKR